MTFKKNSSFKVELTTRPDTLIFEHLKKFNAIVSNWNSWPENEVRWPATAEQGLLKFVKEGGGLVFFHASTSVFYKWPEFKQISTAAWVEDTYHGPKCPVKVEIDNRDHPITKDLADFYIFDELWINAEQNDAFKVLGTASKEDSIKTGHQPAIFVGNYGKGRIFHTILGHDERALRNTGFQTLILRATEWAATGEVSITLPQELKLSSSSESSGYCWVETDSTFGLLQNDEIIWQYNFKTMYEKPLKE